MNAAIDAFFAPEVRPFAIAAALMVALAAIELLSTLAGFSINQLVGKEIDLHGESDNAIVGLLIWINAGRVPLLVLLLLILGIFSIEGFFLQGIARSIKPTPPTWIVALAAIVGTIPVVKIASRGISRIIPRDETYVVSEADFIGHVGTVSIGPLDQGLPGRIRLKDVFGNWHNVPARAGRDAKALPVGARVLLVDRDAKGFIAILAPDDLAAQQTSSNET
jgi:hypothetical protein